MRRIADANSELTRRQREVLERLLATTELLQRPPSLAELCEALGMTSRGSLHKHITALVDAGLVQPLNGRHRGIQLTDKALADTSGIPLLGYIAAGLPLEAIETPELIDFEAVLVPHSNCFVLQVRGNSMIDEGILDGDWIVVERREQARNGEIVVALIDREEATLKRLQQTPDAVILYPANPDMEPMTYTPDRVQIQGVLVGQLRSYR